MAVVRIGSNRSPRSRPARAANSTGAYGGRKVVVPSSAMSTPRASAMIPEAITPEVLPWSWAVPMVVYRLTCSTDRRPAPVARRRRRWWRRAAGPRTGVVGSGRRRRRGWPGFPASGRESGTDHSTAGGFSTHSAVDRGIPRPARANAECAQRRGGGLPRTGHARVEVQVAGGGAGHPHRGHGCGGQERAELGGVAELSAGLAEQVHGGVPAAGDQQGVAVQHLVSPTSPSVDGECTAVTRSVPSVPVMTLPVRTAMPEISADRLRCPVPAGGCRPRRRSALRRRRGRRRRRRRCRWW